jgi:predicted secreted protein
MKWTSIIAIYGLFWVMTAFFVLPFGVKTADEMGVDKIPGQADSAPANFNPKRVILHTTIISLIIFALYYANYVFGWITASNINMLRR